MGYDVMSGIAHQIRIDFPRTFVIGKLEGKLVGKLSSDRCVIAGYLDAK